MSPALPLDNYLDPESQRRQWERQQMAEADRFRRDHVTQHLSRGKPIGVGRLLRKLKRSTYTHYTTDSLTEILNALAGEGRALHINHEGWIKL